MAQEKLGPLEEGLLEAMQAIDKQIEREVGKRSPQDLEEHGVQKWEPYERRVERICSYVLGLLGENQVGLDSLLVLAQALTKSLHLIVGELGEESLGKVRTKYCEAALEHISRDAHLGLQAIKLTPPIN